MNELTHEGAAQAAILRLPFVLAALQAERAAATAAALEWAAKIAESWDMDKHRTVEEDFHGIATAIRRGLQP